jgi:hypothetical protein
MIKRDPVLDAYPVVVVLNDISLFDDQEGEGLKEGSAPMEALVLGLGGVRQERVGGGLAA